jgi:hypothetical protein
MRQAKWKQDGSGLISASEIACYAYCPEQYRLQYGLELLPANRAALDAGTRHHWWKAIAERIAGVAIGIGRALSLVGEDTSQLHVGLEISPEKNQAIARPHARSGMTGARLQANGVPVTGSDKGRATGQVSLWPQVRCREA